jgi:crotonobetainyl-CoA:carnitine CoA-transferase CaiB-like acyl-CoA transferase
MRMSLEHPSIGKLEVPGIPYKLNATPASGRSAPPLLGEHTDDILRELGLSAEQIDALRKSNAI